MRLIVGSEAGVLTTVTLLSSSDVTVALSSVVGTVTTGVGAICLTSWGDEIAA